MDPKESERLFKEADQLYREGRYGEALQSLEPLDAAFPDTKNILLPKAMCLVHLGQVDAAQSIYERLAARHPVEKLRKLGKLLEKSRQDDPLDALDAVLGAKPDDLANARITASPQSVREARERQEAAQAGGPAAQAKDEGRAWGKWAAIGGGVALLLVIIIVPFFANPDAERPQREQPEMTVITEDGLEDLPAAEARRFLIVLAAVAIPVFIVLLPLPIFLTLLFFGELPRETFWENYGILLLYMLGIYLMSSIIAGVLSLVLPGGIGGLGWLFGFLYLVHATFELGFARTLIFFGFNVAVVVLIEAPLLIMLLRLFHFEVPFSAVL